MELRQLRYVIAVAEELHFGRAAVRMNISQPPLSQQIRQLEDEIGIKIFLRTKRRVQLTEPGQLFIEEARQVIEHANLAVRLAGQLAHGENSGLKAGQLDQLIVGTVTAEKPIVIDALRIFSRRYPDVHLELRSLSTAAQVQALNEGVLHVGFVVMPISEPQLSDPKLDIEIIARDPLVVAMPETHPLAGAHRIALPMLAREPSILLPRPLSPRYFDNVIGLCRNAGVDLRIFHEVDNVYTALALVMAGMGVALFPSSTQGCTSRGIVFRKLQPGIPRANFAMVHLRESRTGAMTDFLRLVRQLGAKGPAKAVTQERGPRRVPA